MADFVFVRRETVDARHTAIVERLDAIAIELGCQPRLCRDGDVARARRDDEDFMRLVLRRSADGLCPADIDGAGFLVVLRLGHLCFHEIILLAARPRREQAAIARCCERLEDGEHLFLCLACRIDDFRKALPRLAAVIDVRKSHVLKGSLAERFGGILFRDAAVLVRLEETQNIVFRHVTPPAAVPELLPAPVPAWP